MGTWGYGLLDSDPALDIIQLWREYVEEDPQYDHAAVEDRCFRRWGDAIRYGDSITNAEILALVALHLNSNLAVSKKLRKTAIDAINRELVQKELDEWKDPEKRKYVLSQLLDTLGGKQKSPRKPKIFRDPSLQYKNSSHARSELMKIVKEAGGKPWITYMVEKQSFPEQLSKNLHAEIPPFLTTLDRYMKHRLWEKDYNISWQASVERLMMLATYLGISLKMSEEEISQLLDRCDISKRHRQQKNSPDKK